MRRMLILVAAALALSAPQPKALAKSVQQEFSQAWTDRGARYEQEQLRLNKQIDDAWKSLEGATQASSPDVKSRTDQFIVALQDGAYMHGRAALLSAFKEHMAKKPSAAATDLWVQERVDTLRMQADALDKRGEQLKTDTSAGTFKGRLRALADSAEFMGTVAEMQLVDQNLATYFKAKSAQDEQRRRARAAFFGALAGSFGSTPAPPPTPWIATCQTTAFGNSTTCRGQ